MFCFVLIAFIKGLNITVVPFRVIKMFHWYIYFFKKNCVEFVEWLLSALLLLI